MFRFLVLIFAVGAGSVFGQQRPQYTMFTSGIHLLNPAVSGIESFKDLRMGYREQWAGFDNAPQTAYLSFHTQVGEKSSSNSRVASANPYEGYPAPEKHHGLGFYVISDKAGIFLRTDFNATYAYHIPVNPNLNLSLGMAWGFAQVNLNQLDAGEESINDPAFGRVESKQTKPVFSPGIYLYSRSFFFGLSAAELLLQKLRSGNTDSGYDAKLYPHYYAVSGYKLSVSDSNSLVFSALITNVKSSTLVDFNTKMTFKNRFSVGAGYRHKDAFSALVGFNVNSLLNLGYSYDYTTSDLSSVSNGSHEIVLGLKLSNTYKLLNPQYLF